jgi:hypothetical protein
MKAREERRRVVLPVRMRVGAGWDDACILDISSRGLMIRAQAPVARGSYVELRKGEHAIVARVVWQDERRLGLCTQDRLEVEQILSGKPAAAVQLVSTKLRTSERRSVPRSHEESRTRARLFEFATVALFGASLAALAFTIVHDTLARPLELVREALGG